MSFEEDDLREIHEYSEWVRNTEVAEFDGKSMRVIWPSFKQMSPMLTVIEEMVRSIEAGNDDIGFDIKRHPLGHMRTMPKTKVALSYFNYLKAFQSDYAFSNRYVYSPHVTACAEALANLELTPDRFTFSKPGTFDQRTGKAHGALFNGVVAEISKIVKTSAFREQLRVRKRNAKRNEKKALAIEQQVFKNNARSLVLMLHFGFKAECRGNITPEDMQKYRKRFFNNCRSNKLLRGIVDYIWKLEEGDESGLHLHVLIFYTAKSCRDVQIAKAIGEYWVDVVTEGKGQYWNSNANKWLHQKYGHGIGTGEINWDDDEMRAALRTNILYMTKPDQFLKGKRDGCHLFGTSQVEEKSNAGRPRKK